MHFLRLLYTKASQKFTYFCINAAGWYDAESLSYNHALNFMGDNDYVIQGKKVKEADVPFDGCRVSILLYYST